MLNLDDFITKQNYDLMMSNYIHLNENSIIKNIHVGTDQVTNYKKVNLENIFFTKLVHDNFLIRKDFMDNYNKYKNSNIKFLINVKEGVEEDDIPSSRKILFNYQKNVVYTNNNESIFIPEGEFKDQNLSIYSKNNLTNLVSTNLFHPNMKLTYEFYFKKFDHYHSQDKKIIVSKSIITSFYIENRARITINGNSINLANLPGKVLQPRDIIEGEYSDDSDGMYFILFLRFLTDF